MKVYRLDKFIVPHNSRQEFLAKVNEIHTVLRSQAGFVQDFLLEQPLNDEAFNLVTLIEWEDASYIDAARSAVMTLHKNSGFNPQDAMARLGIKADMGTYKSINS
ncbi:MAG: antibiotic biosynthesis monooxygenase [Cellvibrio sp.]